MPRESPNLKKLVGFMAHSTNSQRPLEVKAIAKQIGVHETTVWRLLNHPSNNEMFARLPGKEPYLYYYVPSPKGQRLIDNAIATHVASVDLTIKDHDVSPVANGLKEDVELKPYLEADLDLIIDGLMDAWSNGRRPNQLDGIDALTKQYYGVKAIVHKIEEAIRDLTE